MFKAITKAVKNARKTKTYQDIPCLDFSWKGMGGNFKIDPSVPKTMRDVFAWQNRAFNLMLPRDKKGKISAALAAVFGIIGAPTGSGKSALICFISYVLMKLFPKMRILIAVPQTQIGGGFKDCFLEMPDGIFSSKIKKWISERYYLFKDLDETCQKRLDEFLSTSISGKPKETIHARVAVCTHASLVKLYQRLERDGNLDRLKDICIWIDEAHHAKNGDIDYDADEDYSEEEIQRAEEKAINQLGRFISYVYKQDRSDLRLFLITATFFRGDRLRILPPDVETAFLNDESSRCRRFDFPVDQYLNLWKSGSIKYDYLLYYGMRPYEAISSIIDRKLGKTIIYLPSVHSKYVFENEKDGIAGKIIAAEKIISLLGKKISETEDGVITVKRGTRLLKVINLVDDRVDRRPKKDYINKIKNIDDLDVIITLGMFKEGANWIFANQGIIIGPRNSLVENDQTLGRFLRIQTNPGTKEIVHKDIEMHCLIPFGLDAFEEEMRQKLNDCLNCIFLSMMQITVLQPLTVKITKGKKVVRFGVGLSALPSDQMAMLYERSGKLLFEINNGNRNMSSEELFEAFKAQLPKITDAMGLNDKEGNLAENIWLSFPSSRRKLVNFKNMSEFEFDLVKSEYPLADMLRFASGCTGKDHFKQMRDAINNRKMRPTYQEIEEFVQSFNLGLKSEKEWIAFRRSGCEKFKNPAKAWQYFKKNGKLPEGK